MSDKPAESPKITLEELLALNDEIVALVRAGVPLELGLAELGEEGDGILGRLGTQLARRMNRGESLPEALGKIDVNLPKSYRVIVEAGIRAGRLTAALEGVSIMALKMSELRRQIGLALVYPLIVFMLAYGLFLLLCSWLAPRFQLMFRDMDLGSGGLMGLLSDLGGNIAYWAWIPPAVVVALILWWWKSGKRGFLCGDGTPGGLVCLCPGVKRIATFYRSAQFADLLALLIEQDVPLPEAIVLAAETTSDLQMEASARAIADATSRGLIVPSGLPGSSGFPPFLHWLITRREEQKGLVSALKAAADMYRRRAVLITEWIQVAFPMLAAVVIGGGATLIYALTVFWPLTEILKFLSEPLV